MRSNTIGLEDYYRNKNSGSITEAELEQMVKDGYPISFGGGIPSDYDGNMLKTHQVNNGERK